MIGIYRILNLVNGKMYIGQSIDVKARIRSHKSKLNKNIHINTRLNHDWNKYGKENFKFELIEKCLKVDLNEREIYWIKFYDSCDSGYNLEYGGMGVGRRSFETLQKVSISNTGKTATIKARLRSSKTHKGHKMTELTKQKLLEANKNRKGKSKTSVEIVKKIKIRIAEGIDVKSIANEYGVSYQIVSYIKNGRTWKWVKVDK